MGGDDTIVIQLNREAQEQLRCECDLRIVPGATHLFEEPGTLAQAAALARDWFADHFTRSSGSPPEGVRPVPGHVEANDLRP